MVHKSKVINGLTAYIDAEIVSKMAGGWKAWVIGGMAGLAATKADAVFEQLANHPAVKALGIIDGENVDVDAIYAELIKQAQRGSATVDAPIIGPITFKAEDVESLYRYMKGA